MQQLLHADKSSLCRRKIEMQLQEVGIIDKGF